MGYFEDVVCKRKTRVGAVSSIGDAAICINNYQLKRDLEMEKREMELREEMGLPQISNGMVSMDGTNLTINVNLGDLDQDDDNDFIDDEEDEETTYWYKESEIEEIVPLGNGMLRVTIVVPE